MESNDSPKIPYRGETSDIPGLPSGVGGGKEKGRKRQANREDQVVHGMRDIAQLFAEL